MKKLAFAMKLNPLFIALFVLFLVSCASAGREDEINLLTSAGFQPRTPETAEQKRVYAAMPPYAVKRGQIKGRTVYGYKDKRNGIAFVGGEEQYQRYRLLAAEQKFSRTTYAADDWGTTVPWEWYDNAPRRLLPQ